MVTVVTEGHEGWTLDPEPNLTASFGQVDGPTDVALYELKSIDDPEERSELDLKMRWAGEQRFPYRQYNPHCIRCLALILFE